MKKPLKSIAFFVTWVYLLTCFFPPLPCYGTDSDEEIPPISTPKKSPPTSPEENSGMPFPLQVLGGFFGTLLKPPSEMVSGAVRGCCEKLKQEGLGPCVKNAGSGIGNALREYPADSIQGLLMILTQTTPLGEAPLVASLANGFGKFRLLKQILEALEVFGSQAPSNSRGSRCRAGFPNYPFWVGVAILAIACPGADGADTLIKTKSEYPGGPCPPEPWGSLLAKVNNCLAKETEPLGCIKPLLEVPDLTSQWSIYRRHPTTSPDPHFDLVSRANNEGKICVFDFVQRAFGSGTYHGVRETCFKPFGDSNPVSRELDLLPFDVQRGIEPGRTVFVVEIRKGGASCVFIKPNFVDTNAEGFLGPTPQCVTSPTNPTIKVCVNPNDPTHWTVKQETGLNPSPHSGPVTSPETGELETNPLHTQPPCSDKTPLGFWGTVKQWLWGKSPCAHKGESPSRGEL